MQQIRELNVLLCSSSNMQSELRHLNCYRKNNSGIIIPSSKQNPMKRLFVPILTVALATTFLIGCAWQVGGDKKVTMQPTTGQQLIDLQKAKDSGAISDSEYQAKKARLLGSK